MGKNIKGKKLPKGITQRKDDAKYIASFVDKAGKRHQKRFNTVPEAERWLYEVRQADKFGDDGIDCEDMTVDEWFKFWHGELIKDLAANTKRNYNERYVQNIKPIIGKMKLKDVKPMHCTKILNSMDNDYAGSTIYQTYVTLGTMFKSAKLNGKIKAHPLDGVKFTKSVKAVDDYKCPTIEEMRKFLEVAKRSHNYCQYVLLLETGLRTGEMIALTWDNIDWEKRTLTVEKTMEFRYKRQQFWVAGPPKTKSSYRTIPLTSRAYEVLAQLYAKKDTRKQSPQLDTVLEYVDKRKDQKQKRQFNMKDLVFVNFRTGMPDKNSSYDTHLYKLCDEAGIRRFCMHQFRHFFCSRAIEAGMPPKTLQRIAGHAYLTTLERYVHVTDNSLEKGIRTFEQGQIANGLTEGPEKREIA